MTMLCYGSPVLSCIISGNVVFPTTDSANRALVNMSDSIRTSLVSFKHKTKVKSKHTSTEAQCKSGSTCYNVK